MNARLQLTRRLPRLALPRRPGGKGATPRGEQGAVLVEVVLALVLFVGAAAVITGGMNASLQSVERSRAALHAANLAASVIAELQLGIRSLELTGPEPFDAPYDKWTWEIVTTSSELISESDSESESPLTQVEVIIRRQDPPVTFRLSELIRPGSAATASFEASSATTAPF